ncbi:MAG: GMC family oxidoreductase [Pseudomonadota bacterium]
MAYEERCQAVVVGSGAGGAVAAAELAEAGWDVIVLEEGGHYLTEDFSADPLEMIPKLYRDGGTSMIWGKPNIYFSEGKCVGGSTTINGGVCWRTPEKILNRWQDLGIKGISPREMAPFFERVEKRANIGFQDPESIGRANDLFIKGCEKLGLSTIPSKRNQIHCAGSNCCILGCPTGAKQSTLVSYLPRAQKFGARLIPDMRVEKIIFIGNRAKGVEGKFVGRSDRFGEKLVVHADVVVVAGGAAQTPVLLMRSGVKHKQLGKNLLCHPNVKVVGVFEEDVSFYKGVCQSHQSHEFFDEGLILAMAGVPPGLIAASFPQYGRQSADIMVGYNNMVLGGALLEDTGNGQVKVGLGGEATMRYAMNKRDTKMAIRGASLLAQLMLAAGAKKAYLPFHGADPIDTMEQARAIENVDVPAKDIEFFTVHIMGTARMGPDPKQFVVDDYGEVFDSSGLFVVDASVFPGSIGVNPMETIMALSTRFSLRLADRKNEFCARY